MRKSFTRLSSLLVLLLLSIQVALAVPKLATTNGLVPADGGQVNPTPNPVFTMTFQANVLLGDSLQIIGLYNSNGVETKAIQLRPGKQVIPGSPLVITRPDGEVTFNGNVVTVKFTGVDWNSLQNDSLFITVGATAIKDANGNFFDITTPFDFGKRQNRWDFKVADTGVPTVKALYPPDENPAVVPEVSTHYHPFAIKFKETVRMVDQNPSAPGIQYDIALGDFALYTATDMLLPTTEEGGDLISLENPHLHFYRNGSFTTSSSALGFDSITIDWEVPDHLPNNSLLYVRVKPGIIEDLSGNDFAGINNNTDWNFSTKDDEFDAPSIYAEHNTPGCSNTPLYSDDEFYIRFAEHLYYTNGDLVKTDDDLTRFITLTDSLGAPLAIKSAKYNSSGDIITVIPNAVLLSSGLSFKVQIVAEAFIDASGNKSKGAVARFKAGNWDAPIMATGWPKVVNQGGTTMDFLVKANKPSHIKYIVVRKDPVNDPTDNDIFGRLKSLGAATKNVGQPVPSAALDEYYRIPSTFLPDYPFDPAINPQGNLKTYYGKESPAKKHQMVEIYAEGMINLPIANLEVQHRIAGFPAKQGTDTDSTTRYEIWYELIDTTCTQGKYGDWWEYANEHIVKGSKEDNTVYTTDILMPEVWFDGDSAKVTGDNLPNKTKLTPPYNGNLLGQLIDTGYIYINFNEPIRKENNQPFSSNATTQSNELKQCFFVHEGSLGSMAKWADSDTAWVRNINLNSKFQYGFTAKLSADLKQIIIKPDSSWRSSDTIYVKFRNSKIEDYQGNEIVPYGGLYTQRFKVENYNPPLVRYTYDSNYRLAASDPLKGKWITLHTPLDSALKIPYYQDGLPTSGVAAPLTVTVSSKIYVFPGCNLESGIVAPGVLKPFQDTDTSKLDFIGRFFKIRKQDANTVSESWGNALELSDFTWKIQSYGVDSTLITITPRVPYTSEVWYLIQMDGRIQDSNLRTINAGADVANADRPNAFKLAVAPTGNARTVGGWYKTNEATDDNKTCVFKTEDSRNPELTFYTKKQSSLLDDLENIDKKTNIDLSDTIGVYIDEYVSLGFDHYIQLEMVEGSPKYTLDANAMRRYFNVYSDSASKTKMGFDVVGLDISALEHDSLIFYIDPYYVKADSTANTSTEGKNFASGKTYWVHFNSHAMLDANGINTVWGKSKGIYWDDNHNIVLDKWARFSTPPVPAPSCVQATITPAPGASCQSASDLTWVSVGFLSGVLSPYPYLTVREGTSSVHTFPGEITPGNSNVVRYNIHTLLKSDSLYSLALGVGTRWTRTLGGDIHINSGVDADMWPSEDCDLTDNNDPQDTVWTYQMVDETAPHLDTTQVAHTIYYMDGSTKKTRSDVDYLFPQDDSCNYDKTKNLVLVFNENVDLVNNKTLTIYDSEENVKARIYAQQCFYGKTSDYKNDNHKVIIVPSNAFASNLIYNTDYHINIDAGFVKDQSACHPNDWAGIWVKDIVADCDREGDNDWSFRTGPDPEPYFTLFNPQNGSISETSKLAITFSEAVDPINLGGGEIKIFELTGATPLTKIQRATLSVSVNAQVTKLAADQYQLTGFEPIVGKQYCVLIPRGAFEDKAHNILRDDCDTTGIHYVLNPISVDQTDEAAASWYLYYGDDSAPTALNTWPRNGYKNIPYGAYIYIEFSEAVEINDGSAVVPQPLLNQTIDQFLTVTDVTASSTLNYAKGEYDVEFVGNNKRLLRITPMDSLGYNFNGTSRNPSMVPFHEYSVTLAPTNGSYSIRDKAGNLLSTPPVFAFRVEDITPPAITSPTVSTPECGANQNKFNLGWTITDNNNLAGNTKNNWVYYAVLPKADQPPTAAAIFAQTVSGAIFQGKKERDNDGTISVTIDMGTSYKESPEFKVYAVGRDSEIDPWQPASSAWDTLFMFKPANGYGESTERILDRMPAGPDHLGNRTAAPVVSTFKIYDDDAPWLKGSTYANGATKVPVNATFSFWFSEKVVPGRVVPDAITLRRADNNIAIEASVTWSHIAPHADSIFKITPAVNLDQETTYYVEFDRYAIRDSADVCSSGRVYYKQMLFPEYMFTTQDNLGPRFVVANPKSGDECVSCPDLNKNGKDTITIDFYDANEVKVASSATDPFVYLYRTIDPTNAWLIVPASQIKVVNAKGAGWVRGIDTLWHVKVPVTHQYYPNDYIRAFVPAGLIVDEFSNKYTNSISGYTTGPSNSVQWYYTTCNTLAPDVLWSVHNLVPYFNYSYDPDEVGIYGKWHEDFRNGEQGQPDPLEIPTNIALKISFGEEVQFNTSSNSTPKWEDLNSFAWGTSSSNLTPTELMSVLNITGLKFEYKSPMSSSTVSDIDTIVYDPTHHSVTFLFRYGSNAKLPDTQLLTDAAAITGHITTTAGAPGFLNNRYKASLKSDEDYEVTVANQRVRAKANCEKLLAPRYVPSHIVTLNTRNDKPPTVTFRTYDGDTLCNANTCIDKNDSIVIHFSDSIVKTSFDVSWLGEESFTYDNLPLKKADLLYPIKNTSPYHYVELIKLQTNGSTYYKRDAAGHKGDTVTINHVTLDPALQNYVISSDQTFDSEGWYELVFKKYTVKKYEGSDPSGTIYEGGDTCRFFVGDYIAPEVYDLDPDSGKVNVPSDTKEILIKFNEGVKIGKTTEKTLIRRKDGSVFKEYVVGDFNSKVKFIDKTTPNDSLVFIVNALENFTTYFVEMPVGFVTDDNIVCDPNPFAGFGARLASDSIMMSADYWFSTSDSTPPELMAVLGSVTEMSPDALYPKVNSIVSTNSNLIMTFDEDVEIDHHASDWRGIVIYHDDGETGSFGNAVEFIPWSDFYTHHGVSKISFSGSSPYDGLSNNVITINPSTVFDKKGVYYVRVNGVDIVDASDNSWSESINEHRDPITDREWKFNIVNDAAPILVEKSPAYDGVGTPQTYVKVPSTEPTLGFVKADLSMTFEDANGDPIDVAPGGSTRTIKIFEYTYDAATAQYKSKPWITLPISDPSIEFVGNVVTIKDVMLRDGINNKIPKSNTIYDSVYYVTVDNGAIVNALDQATAWWPGIDNAFVWRFQTKDDNTFVSNAKIISPLNGAVDLKREDAALAVVEFGEPLEALKNAIPATSPRVQLFKVGGTHPVDSVIVTKAMITGKTLSVPFDLTKIEDETNYFVQIQAAAFGDTSTISTPNTAFGGAGEWAFLTGDNTAPVPDTKTPISEVGDGGCVERLPVLTMVFTHESRGVTKGAGTLTIKDAAGKTWASIEAEAVTISEDGKTVTAQVTTDLPDSTLLTVNVPEGFVKDMGNNALKNPAITDWTFTTAENTPPTVVITPDVVVTPNAVLTLTFSEVVIASEGNITVSGMDPISVDSLKSVDGIVYTYPLIGLSSETKYQVSIPTGAFIDVNDGCVPNKLAAKVDSFAVGDISAPLATGSPKAAADYVGLKLNINFTDAVTPAEIGNVVIYNAEGVAIETIKATDFTASEGNSLYTYAPTNVKFGSYYILIDAGAFVDLSATLVGQNCPGISDPLVWPLVIKDPSFDPCITLGSMYPARNAINVQLSDTIKIAFCTERIAPGIGKFVTLGEQSATQIPNVNYWEFQVTTAMIKGGKLAIPVTGLKENTTYGIIVQEGAITDEAGNPFRGIINVNDWFFTTGDFTNPIVTVATATVTCNDGIADPIAITSSEAGTVYLVKNDVTPITEAGFITAIAAKKAVVAIVTTGDVAVQVNAEGLLDGTYNAYGFDASGRMGKAVNVVTLQLVPIVQYKTIKQIQGEVAASPLVGTKVRTNGTVTAVTSTGFYMQDANAAWSGIFVTTVDVVGVGSSVEVIGTVAEVGGMTTIGTVEKISYIAPVVAPKALVITAAQVIEEMYEGVLVKVTGRVATAGAVTADWTIKSSGSKDYTINNALFGSYTTLKDYRYDVTGIAIASGTTYKVLAIEIENASARDNVSALANSVKVYPNPFDKYITLTVSNDIVITKAVITNIAGQRVKEVINPSNTIPTSELRSGVYFISLHTVDGIAKTERIIKR